MIELSYAYKNYHLKGISNQDTYHVRLHIDIVVIFISVPKVKMNYLELLRGYEILKPSVIPSIRCIFLTQFDMKRGNMVIWSKQLANNDINLDGIEFKSLPSGVHEISNGVIHFIVPKENSPDSDPYYYGVAFYKQNGQDMAESQIQIDRSKVKMYALGVILDSSSSDKNGTNDGYDSWKQNRYIGTNYYIEDLKYLLSTWMEKEEPTNFTDFQKYFRKNSELRDITSSNEGINIRKKSEGNELHMLEDFPFWIKKLGPLIFPLWKACLLNEKILILNPSGGSFQLCNSLVYCLSLISVLTKKTDSLNYEDSFIRPLFTLGVNDIDFLKSVIFEPKTNSVGDHGYIACTSDEVLSYKPELYDKILKLSSNFMKNDSDALPRFSTNEGAIIQATPHELKAYETLMHVIINENISSIQRNYVQKLIEPVSWFQYLIDGFYFWSTAGCIKAAYHQKISAGIILQVNNDNSEDDKTSMVLSLVKYFHVKNNILLNNIKSLLELNQCQSSDDIIYVSRISLLEMDLDCFSEQDIILVQTLMSKWFGKNVVVNSSDFIKSIC